MDKESIQYQEEFIKRISKMGPNLVIKVPKDRHRDFDRGDLVRVSLIKKNHGSIE
ncbi:MAG: hypothetical protein KKG75_01755 [Nanoarchaeota archaeon]|nr:hypothetical protein [Nanoarchaeota archaeon]